ncbi:leucine-rich repeat-containing protein 23 [Esox lucius]|uniref:Leucine-rich repeat-containing protein 23 n=1 Tax=Esox lucius TaxID=8010 RepID=A0A3P8YX04_ESOLU|nr:leucine-rich repeat-containing protein 23 [Esox lucius]XP_034151951.1 leucine-rich repeat-containing protein 23 [Esox lucius]XP_034151952.1 leucine-rich repeat-containing protein 23 [Esox lucius]
MSEMEDGEVALSEGEETVNEGGGEGVEENMTEKEDTMEPCPLTQDMITQGLSMLCHTGSGLAHAFVKLELKDKRLTDIALVRSFVHVRFLDVSSNHLSDLSPLAALAQLLWLKCDGNKVPGFKGQPLGQLMHLQWLSLALNHLKDLEGLEGVGLESLNLTGNRIQRVSGLQYHRLTNLVTLELRGNKLETTDGIHLPNLRQLYLAQNIIKHLEGLDKLERLTTLHLRDNQLTTLDGISPNMKSLQYLNVRGNLVFSQRGLQSLVGVSRSLRVLVLMENPVVEMEDYRVLVLTHLPLLECLDKEPVSPEEKTEAHEKLRGFSDEEAAVTEPEDN